MRCTKVIRSRFLPIRKKLIDAVEELRQLLNNHHDLKVVETPIYGYVWLNMETAHQLELLSSLICRALRK